MLLKKNWVLVFSFMYLVSVDPMDRSLIFIFSSFHVRKRMGLCHREDIMKYVNSRIENSIELMCQNLQFFLAEYMHFFEIYSFFFIFSVFMSENGWDCVQDHREDIMKCVNSSVPELFNENIKQKYSNIHMLIYSPENCRRGNYYDP
jgi:hypothetical protein